MPINLTNPLTPKRMQKTSSPGRKQTDRTVASAVRTRASFRERRAGMRHPTKQGRPSNWPTYPAGLTAVLPAASNAASVLWRHLFQGSIRAAILFASSVSGGGLLAVRYKNNPAIRATNTTAAIATPYIMMFWCRVAPPFGIGLPAFSRSFQRVRYLATSRPEAGSDESAADLGLAPFTLALRRFHGLAVRMICASGNSDHYGCRRRDIRPPWVIHLHCAVQKFPGWPATGKLTRRCHRSHRRSGEGLAEFCWVGIRGTASSTHGPLLSPIGKDREAARRAECPRRPSIALGGRRVRGATASRLRDVRRVSLNTWSHRDPLRSPSRSNRSLLPR